MVVSRVGGNPDLITDGERGYVVERHQPAQLADAFDRVISDPQKAKQLGRAARAFVEKQLTLEKLCAEHDRMYSRVVTGR
jgi:glycosyltransferase involved in cell wall biosynthesis